MELVYLWVENYKNIEKQGFNFSPKFRCEYNPETNELKIEENKNYVPLFPDNINITAIVGKNGSGKSSVLEILKYCDCYSYDYKKYICFALFFNEETKEFYIHKNVSINIILYFNNTPIKYKIFRKGIGIYNKIHNIYYTNNPKVFNDFDNGKQFSKHLCNISDKYLYEKILRNIQEQYKSNLRSFEQILEIYNSKLLQYGIEAFYNKDAEFPDDWQLPDKIIIELNYKYVLNSFNYILLKLKDDIDKFKLENNDKFKEKEKKDIRKLTNLEYLKSLIVLHDKSGIPLFERFSWKYVLKWLSILNFIVYSYQGMGEIINEELIMNAIEKIKNYSNNTEQIDAFIEYFNRDFKINNALYSLPKEYFYNVKEIIKNLEQFEVKDNFLSIKLYKQNIFRVLNIIKLHQKITITVAPFLIFNLYPWMSDGHQEYFFVFAKFCMCLETPFSNKKPSRGDKVFMYLDEIINFFHPNWQKSFIKVLINFFEKNYNDFYFHIIFTTHSPFIISDLPKENIIFLDKDENGKCKVVDGLNEKKETFGANIHTLLSDSFFMEDGFIGKFAESKIDEVIRYLNGEKIEDMNDEKAQKIINIIGEPILRKELQKRLDSKRLSKFKEVDKIKREMRMLKNRMKKLERLLNEKDNNN